MASHNPTLKIGARGSQLATWQARWVADLLQSSGHTAELVVIRTQGDVEQSGPVRDLGIQGVFTNEIQQAVLSGAVDLAVHSLKDLPTARVEGLALAAVPRREEASDALVMPANRGDLAADVLPIDAMPPKARIGTGSARRQAQLKHLRPDFQVTGIRGNVDTRLRKLDAGEFDAIVLAAAGLRRLGLGDRISQLLSPPQMLPAPGQGALAIECRADDSATIAALAPLDDVPTYLATLAERTVLATLRGGCSTPVGTWGRCEGDVLLLDALVASSDGRQMLRAAARGALEDAVALGHVVAEDLKLQGAERIV